MLNCTLTQEPKRVLQPRSHSQYDNRLHGWPDEPKTGEMLNAASRLAEAGFAVFPVREPDPDNDARCSCKPSCNSPAKHPRITGGFHNATTEQAKIDGWWGQWSNANIGIRTGAESGIIVVDIDPCHGGDESLAQLESSHGGLPKTMEQRSGSGGRHLFFRHPGEDVPNSAGKLGEGLDIRGDGGYIISAPSRNTVGRYIAFGRGGIINRDKIVDAPAWLIEMAQQPASVCSSNATSTPTPTSTPASVTATGTIGEGSRHTSLTSLAGTMRRPGMSPESINAALQIVNQQRCNPPLSETEVASIAASVGAYEPAGGCDEANKPIMRLPGGGQRISDTARDAAVLLAGTGDLYTRAGVIVTKRPEQGDGGVHFDVLTPSKAASLFETVARLVKTDSKGNDKPATCSKTNAELIMASSEFISNVPAVDIVTRSPVLVEDEDGGLYQVTGYDPTTRILASGDLVSDVPLDQAVGLLKDMLSDFDFDTPGDRSRALAAVITPALVHGGLLGGRPAADLGEANESQAGKGFRNKLTFAVYNEKPKVITQTKGGVGSIEEAFGDALVKGRSFVVLDNVKGKVDSPYIESALTEDVVNARVPYRGNVDVDPSRTIFMVTSNKAELTPDMANRTSCVQINKRPDNHSYREYPEGTILDHVRANQPLYLGAVFAVVQAWHAAGKPRTDEIRHDFKVWARTLDWIVRNIFQATPLLDGHDEIKGRVTNTHLNWVRDVANAVESAGQLGRRLRTNELLGIIDEQGGIEIPGCGDDGDLDGQGVRKNVWQAIGRRLGKFFGGETSKRIGTMQVEKIVEVDHYSREVKQYRFQRVTALIPDGGDDGDDGDDGDNDHCGAPQLDPEDDPFTPPPSVTIGG